MVDPALDESQPGLELDERMALCRSGARVEEAPGERALQPRRSVDWKSLLLWGLLVGGAVLVAALGLSLLRQRPASAD